MDNPFLAGKPVPPEYFVGREALVDRIYGCLRSNSHNVLLVDVQKGGKTSLLTYLRAPQVRQRYLGSQDANFSIIKFDCELLPSHYKPADFWRHVLTARDDRLLESEVATLLSSSVDALSVGKFLESLVQRRRKLVLLIDEFDLLLGHPNLGGGEFLGALRALSSAASALSIVAASPLDVAQLNDRTSHKYGSPKFNTFQNERLSPFSDLEVGSLLTQYLGDSPLLFSELDRSWIWHVSGGWPFLVQTAAWVLFDVTMRGAHGRDKYEAARRWLQAETDEFCERICRNLPPRERQLLSQVAHGAHPDPSWPEDELAMSRIVEQLLIEKVAGQWQVRSQCLAWWLTRYTLASQPATARTISQGVPRRRDPISIFVSAAETDVDLCRELETHLGLLGRQIPLACQHRGKIEAGQVEREWLLQQARTADLIIVILSVEHLHAELHSDAESELEIAWTRADAGHAQLVPVLGSPTLLEGTPFCTRRSLPQNQCAVRLWEHRSQAWKEVSAEIGRCLRQVGCIPAHPLTVVAE